MYPSSDTMHLVCWLRCKSYNFSFLIELPPLSCRRQREGKRNSTSKVYRSITPMRLRFASFIQMPIPIKYSASLSPRSVALQGLSSAQLQNDFWEDKVDRARIYSAINHYKREAGRVFIWQQHASPRRENCWTAHKPESSIASSVQGCTSGLQLGSVSLQIIRLKCKIGTE